MKKSFFFYKELTPAEVGKTGTHEVYIRMPNNFDYETFFGNSSVVNGTVIEVSFTANDLTNGGDEAIPLRFVYFVNSNREKRIPSLGPLFKKHNVQDGDIVCLESTIDGESFSYNLCFYKKGEIEVNPSSIYFSSIERELSPNTNQSHVNQPLQQIFYGAPGTGKSNTIKKETEEAEKEGRVFRTTFHPDSDYSTFVGCYKPSMKSSERVYSLEELTAKLKEIKTSGTTYPCHKFGAKYWKSLKDLSAENIKRILTACGFTETMNVEVSKGIAIGQEYLNNSEDGKIVYAFTPQAFTNAYVKAWNTTENVYLIIEEINRGNCAQIFGDLFQLLDRKEGKSEYPIDADTDLMIYLSNELANSTRDDFPEGVKEGKKLVLPPNLYIWATMNTSDQSLFPIDSAFKRRWDWVYIPIKNHEEESYKIDIDGAIYDWWGFLEKINNVIGQVTSSEDKKLGYFFVKAPNKVVDAKKFVGKVLFYLWNDVFKNYGFENAIFSKGENKIFTFSEFFDKKGEPETTVVNEFLKKLDETIDKEHSFVSIDNDGSPSSSLIVKYMGEYIEGDTAKSKYIEIIKRVIEEKGVEQVANVIGAELTQTPSDNSREYKPIGDSGWYLVTRIGTRDIIKHLNKIKEQLGVDIVFDRAKEE